MKKHIPLLILTLFLGGCAPTSPNLGVAVPPPVLPKDGIKHNLLFGRSEFSGVITVGDKNKGRGIFIITAGENKGSWYDGDFLGTKFHGLGTIHFFEGENFINGSKYVGEWKNGLANGQGTHTLANGEKYVGEYKDGKQNGQGTATFVNGRKYVGGFKDDTFHGQGTFTSPDGSKYVGEYKDGKQNGQGTYTSPDGVSYVGEYKDGKINGQGTFTFANGNKYVGEWKDSKYHGQGTLIGTDGSKYVGGFKDALYNGQGTFTFADGSKYVGEWKDGLANGQGTATFADGKKYVGEWKDDKYHGQGIETLANGSKYVGEWKDGLANGQGTETYPDGASYVGEWKDGKVHIAVFYPVNGEPQSGIFNNGNLQTPWTIEAVSNYLKDKYPEFTGLDFEALPPKKEPVAETSSPISTSVKSSGTSISGFMAIIDFEANNISSSEVRALTDRLRSELVTIGQFTIIERGKMDEVLKEQAFQQTGCVSSECAIEVGKILGVENIITGSISKVGTIYSVSARAFSVASGEIIKTAIYDHSGDIGGLLTQGMRKVAEELGK